MLDKLKATRIGAILPVTPFAQRNMYSALLTPRYPLITVTEIGSLVLPPVRSFPFRAVHLQHPTFLRSSPGKTPALPLSPFLAIPPSKLLVIVTHAVQFVDLLLKTLGGCKDVHRDAKQH